MTTKPDLRTTDTKERILKEAQRLYRAGGYPYMGLDQIARTLEITRAALYHHFPGGKEQILIELIQQITLRKASQWEVAIGETQSARQRFRLMLNSVINEPLPDHKQLIIAEQEGLSVRAVEVIRGGFYRLYELAMQVFKEGIERGELRPIELDVAFFSFVGLCKQVEDIIGLKGKLPDNSSFHCSWEAPQTLVEKLLELWLDGLTTGQAN